MAFHTSQILLVRSMCCRLRLDKREISNVGGGLFGSNPLTGSVGVVTINLPKLGYEAKSKQELLERLAKLMDLAKDSLEIKRKTIEHLTESGLYPYSKFYLRNLYKKNQSYWKNHFSTIGIVGMNECVLNYLGEDITTEQGHKMAQEILTYMRERLSQYLEETGNNYNLEATPAESTSYRLARIDKMQYPDIICARASLVCTDIECPGTVIRCIADACEIMVI